MQHLLLTISLSAAIGIAEAFSPIEQKDAPVIIIIQNDGDETVGNRGPVSVPISGYVDIDAGAVFLTFCYPCGTVHVAFDNLSNGSFYETEVNGTGSVVIPILLSSGTWQVVFSLPDDNQFVGEFSI